MHIEGNQTEMAPAAPAPASAPQPTPTQAPVPSQNSCGQQPQGSEFASALKGFAQESASRMGHDFTLEQGVEGTTASGTQNTGFPEGLINNGVVNPNQPTPTAISQTQAPQSPASHQTPETPHPGVNIQPNEIQDPNNPQPGAEGQSPADQQLQEFLFNVGGAEPVKMNHRQVEDAIKGFFYYHNNIDQIEADFQQRDQNLKEQFEAFQQQQQEFQAAQNSENAFILKALETNPQFLAEVIALIEHNPTLLESRNNFENINASQSETQKQLEKIQNQLNEFKQSREAEKAQAQQQAQIREMQGIVNSVQQKVLELNKQLNLPQDFINTLTDQAVFQYRSGQLPMNEAALYNFFAQKMQGQHEYVQSQIRQIQQGYLNQKEMAPPPPPTGGGTPPLSNPPDPSDADARRTRVEAKFLNAGGFTL